MGFLYIFVYQQTKITPMKTINIQIWNSAAAKVWDDCPVTTHFVNDNSVSEVAQAVSTATGCPVRMSFYKPGIPAGNLQGSYFYPAFSNIPVSDTYTVIDDGKK
jgi:hypothetical protein